MNNVVELSQHRKPDQMTDEELKRRWEEIKEKVKDPERADLLSEAVRRHRTEEEIRKVLNLKARYVAYMFVYARFRDFCTAVQKSEITLHALAEWRFRQHYEKTTGNEPQRFKAVIEILKEEGTFRKNRESYKSIGNRIATSRLSDGKERHILKISERLNEPRDRVERCLNVVIHEPGSYGLLAKRKGQVTWIITRRSGDTVDRQSFYQRIRPWLDELKAMGSVSHRLQLSPQDISALAYRIERELIGTINRPAPASVTDEREDETPQEEE